MLNFRIRDANEADLQAIDDIYNFYVVHSVATYQEELNTIARRHEWFARHGAKHPVIVAEADSTVLGWGSISPYHARSAYSRTVENSVYVRADHLRCGIGRALLAELVNRAAASGHHAIIAAIDAEQPGSIALHEAMGFVRAGHFKEVGFKFGRWLDVVYLQKILS